MKRLLIIFLLCAVLLLATTAGPNSPSTNDSGWLNSGNAHTQTDTYAEGDFGQAVQYTNFGFSVGASSTIDGVTVEIDAFKDGTRNNTIQEDLLGAGTCTQKETGVMSTSDTDSYHAEGGAADTWGCTALTGTAVDSTSFGVTITGGKSSGPNPVADSYNLDHVRITVDYTTSGGKRRVMVMSGGG